jgi:cytochrome c2
VRASIFFTLVLTAGVLVSAPLSALADPDLAKGEAIFQERCAICHPADGVGQAPTLTGVVGRKAGAVPGYPYTDALKASGLIWTPQNLSKFLAGPTDMVPGTSMPMTVPDESERADLIAYLASKK